MPTKKTSVAVITCLNNRNQVNEVFFKGIERLKTQTARHYDLKVYAAIEKTEGNIEICERYGVDYVIHNTNGALGAKWNMALGQSIKDPWDIAMIMGDDDLISTAGFRALAQKVKGGYHHVGFNKLFYINSVDPSQCLRFEYMFPNKLIGCGRMISRHAFETTCFEVPIKLRREIQADHYFHRAGEVVFTKIYLAQHLIELQYAEPVKQRGRFNLWHDQIKSGLDNACNLKLAVNGFYPFAVESDNCHLVDIKSSDNIWKFDHRRTQDTEPVEYEEATWFMSDEEKEALEAIPQTLEKPIKTKYK